MRFVFGVHFSIQIPDSEFNQGYSIMHESNDGVNLPDRYRGGVHNAHAAAAGGCDADESSIRRTIWPLEELDPGIEHV